MERETVIEALVEIITAGEYVWKAKELLEEEMKKLDYSVQEIAKVIHLATNSGKDPEADSFAAYLAGILEEPISARILLEIPESLVALYEL